MIKQLTMNTRHIRNIIYVLFACFVSSQLLASDGISKHDARSAEHDKQFILVNIKQQNHHSGWRTSNHHYFQGDWHMPPKLQKTIDKVEEDYYLEIREGWPIKSLSLYCVVFAVGEQSIEPLIQRLNNDPRIEFAEPLLNFTLLGKSSHIDIPSHSDALIDTQYPDNKNTLAAMHSITRGKNINIGIIDSAIDRSHPDINSRLIKQRSFLPKEIQRDFNHGTAVAGVIAASVNNDIGIAGLAPEAKIYAYEACGLRNEKIGCNSFVIAKALEAVLEDDIDILNMSLTGQESRLLKLLLQTLIDRGTIVVAAQPDQQKALATQYFPSSMSDVIGVSSESMASLWFLKPAHLSTRAGGDYQYFFGSSMSSAGMSGFIAWLQAYSSIDQKQALNMLFKKDICENMMRYLESYSSLHSHIHRHCYINS